MVTLLCLGVFFGNFSCKEQQHFQFSSVSVALVKKSKKVTKHKKPFHYSGKPPSQLTERSYSEHCQTSAPKATLVLNNSDDSGSLFSFYFFPPQFCLFLLLPDTDTLSSQLHGFPLPVDSALCLFAMCLPASVPTLLPVSLDPFHGVWSFRSAGKIKTSSPYLRWYHPPTCI